MPKTADRDIEEQCRDADIYNHIYEYTYTTDRQTHRQTYYRHTSSAYNTRVPIRKGWDPNDLHQISIYTAIVLSCFPFQYRSVFSISDSMYISPYCL